jgi:cytochrome c biogenesis protein CcdA
VESNRAAFDAFVVTALTMVLVMALLVTAIGFAQTRVVRSMKMNTQSVKRLGGAVLVVVGIWLIVLAIWANAFTRLFSV